MSFADGDEFYFIWFRPAFLCREFDLIFYFGKIFRHEFSAISNYHSKDQV